ncbi:uncharacterized protein LOC106165991 [Lingula anatina]|uniref:Uncharacterized protein LOC106165991 n=1 Tax=Lingula anatina TaxID=7574 RepID=A0A1S3INL9_LINAN|nr:uncharacterized protein LOC106165991 [Lingula anatina]|eukprot:XP_013399840.1 uncharacterized protein LOC106165991 [Lingula anatina]
MLRTPIIRIFLVSSFLIKGLSAEHPFFEMDLSLGAQSTASTSQRAKNLRNHCEELVGGSCSAVVFLEGATGLDVGISYSYDTYRRSGWVGQYWYFVMKQWTKQTPKEGISSEVFNALLVYFTMLSEGSANNRASFVRKRLVEVTGVSSIAIVCYRLGEAGSWSCPNEISQTYFGHTYALKSVLNMQHMCSGWMYL